MEVVVVVGEKEGEDGIEVAINSAEEIETSSDEVVEEVVEEVLKEVEEEDVKEVSEEVEEEVEEGGVLTVLRSAIEEDKGREFLKLLDEIN